MAVERAGVVVVPLVERPVEAEEHEVVVAVGSAVVELSEHVACSVQVVQLVVGIVLQQALRFVHVHEGVAAVDAAAAAVVAPKFDVGQEHGAGAEREAVARQSVVLLQLLALEPDELDAADAADVAEHSDVDYSDSMTSFAYLVDSIARLLSLWLEPEQVYVVDVAVVDSSLVGRNVAVIDAAVVVFEDDADVAAP